MRAALAFAAVLLLAACEGPEEPAPGASETAAPVLGEQKLSLQTADFPVLASKDCVEVVQFYLEAIGGREWDKAALVWDDPVVDAARLEAVFTGYETPQVEWTEPSVEGAAGSLYCSASGTLTDAGNPARPPGEGQLVLRRVNDVPGATPDQRRWTLQSSTFVETLERSKRG